jgi:hypothetical protein
VARANQDSGVARYLRDIDKVPLLSSDEEQKLARRWRDRADPVAADRLVTSHLRLVAKIAADFAGYDLPFSQLISEGNIGMMRAMKRFDPDRGFRLATYAIWWIRASIQEYVMRSRSLVRIGTTSAQRRLFFNLRFRNVHEFSKRLNRSASCWCWAHMACWAPASPTRRSPIRAGALSPPAAGHRSVAALLRLGCRRRAQDFQRGEPVHLGLRWNKRYPFSAPSAGAVE